MTEFTHPLTEAIDNPDDPTDQFVNVWGLAEMTAEALRDIGIHGTAGDWARALLGDTTETMRLLHKVEAGDPAFTRVFIAKFAMEAEANWPGND